MGRLTVFGSSPKLSSTKWVGFVVRVTLLMLEQSKAMHLLIVLLSHSLQMSFILTYPGVNPNCSPVNSDDKRGGARELGKFAF